MVFVSHEQIRTWHLFDDPEYTQCGKFLPAIARELGEDELALGDGQSPPGDGHVCHKCIRAYNHPALIDDKEILNLCQPQYEGL